MDFWGNDNKEKPVEVNIYADEIVSKKCHYYDHYWHYIVIITIYITEELRNTLLQAEKHLYR